MIDHSDDEAEFAPPGEITIHWCLVCGRDDRFVPFAENGWHIRPQRDGGMVSSSWRAERCNGIPIKVRYERSVAA